MGSIPSSQKKKKRAVEDYGSGRHRLKDVLYNMGNTVIL